MRRKSKKRRQRCRRAFQKSAKRFIKPRRMLREMPEKRGSNRRKTQASPRMLKAKMWMGGRNKKEGRFSPLRLVRFFRLRTGGRLIIFEDDNQEGCYGAKEEADNPPSQSPEIFVASELVFDLCQSGIDQGQGSPANKEFSFHDTL